MPKTGISECYFVNVNHKSVERLIVMVKEYLADLKLSHEYNVNVYPGMIPLDSIVLEITGPGEDEIRAIHLRLTSKILGLCEKNGVESHGFEPLEIR